MYEIAKLEFGKWLSKQDIDKMTPYEKTMVGIIIDNFDEIAKYGTAGGKRAKLIGKYIEALGNKADRKDLIFVETKLKNKRIKKLTSLEIENFRGFGVREKFDFSKQYTFYHGPNGSGKTSFCEAIEYSVLGTIAEASARNIPIDRYIIHTGKKKATAPELKCELLDGTEQLFPTSLSDYRFAFIEKNRILDFSHIGAATAKNQADRIAALFGLSEFQTFIHEFTDSFDGRYVTLKSDAKQKYESKKQDVEKKIEQKQKIEQRIIPKDEELKKLIASLKEERIKTSEEAICYLTDSEIGLLSMASRMAADNHIEYIDKEKLLKLKELIKEFLAAIDEIQVGNTEILSDVGSVNLSSLYQTVITLKNTYKESFCPICRTPFGQTVENPFEYAEKELNKLSKVDAAKKKIKSNAGIAAKKMQDILLELRKKEILLLLSDRDIDVIMEASIQATDYEIIDNDKYTLINKIKDVYDLLSTEEMDKKIVIYNENAKANNKRYDDKVAELQDILTQISQASAELNLLKSQLDTRVTELEKEEPQLKALEEAAANIAKIIQFNQEMIQAYEVIRRKLVVYVKELPLKLAENLSEKVREYYNHVNNGDAEFELIDELKLPVSTNDKIMVKMNDGISQDALQILSEGHIRILGLSILLAKAVSEEMPFIVFDDIVNAIDDDHRDGVASLLITHKDFQEMQMILTCHGELFVTNLESHVTDRNKMARYMFLPADTLEERGIVIKYQDSTIPLKVAREKFENHELKDSAAKCRQAVECIAGSLWKKVSPNVGGISVLLRNLQGTPDLRQVVDGLKNATRPKKLCDAEEIHKLLEELTNMKIWDLLNKGTHVDTTLPEFSRKEVKELLELLEKLNDNVRQLKIKATVV